MNTVELMANPQGSWQQSVNVYYSSAVEGDLAGLLGAPHYSYRFAEAKFISAMQAEGVSMHRLQMPEYYNTPGALPEGIFNPGQTCVQLIFRSTEEIRLLKFAWNVCCFAWEFDVIKDWTDVDEHPFLNQKRMLRLCNEIWVPCGYTRDVLAKYGLENVHVIPAPIPMPPVKKASVAECLAHLGHISVAPLHFNFLMSYEDNRSASGVRACSLVEFISSRIKGKEQLPIYLAILNPEDFRKNLDSMLRGFYYFNRSQKDAVLLVKVLTSPSRFHLLDVIADVIPRKLDSGTAIASDNIVFFNDYLSNSEMDCLYSLAKFFICTSLCEGQNLPLLEAMSHGVVPVTTLNTAMLDYINSANAIVIPGKDVPNDSVHLAGTVARRPFAICRSDVDDVLNGLQRSAGLSGSDYRLMARNARLTVQDNYSPKAVWPRIASRLNSAPSLISADIRRRTQS